MEKEKAKDKYDDEIARGNAAVLVSENELDKEVLQILVGNILPS